MDIFRIQGGRPISGTVRVSGAKNAALPLMAATLLSEEPIRFAGAPTRLVDVQTMGRLLVSLGTEFTERRGGELVLTTPTIEDTTAAYDLVRTMRASVLVLGPLLARCGQARVSMPGGCAIGSRPVDLHLKAMESLGARIEVESGYVVARTPPGGLVGGRVVFEKITVGGTENALMAAVLARGESVIENAAREPEIVALVELLRAMGAEIEGEGTHRLVIQGQDRLSGCRFEVPPDRIEAGTLLCAGAIGQGSLTLSNCPVSHVEALVEKLREADCRLKIGEVNGAGIGEVTIDAPFRPRAVDVTTGEYPGFPTDMQAQLMAVMAVAQGRSMFTEKIFENRYLHASELVRMGGDIHVEGRTATIRGVKRLSGAPVTASDLRASASLVLAGLVAHGETIVRRIYHLDRGYENLEIKLSKLGASVTREAE
ncbi:MAG: UDP-N-acetylglucosamine 1-carboxyvinyltransferase [Myxococcales bacterium]|nr:UDP-N-acetylglucosamine 1-carboxyvinyltransferase [Myxococcales bacterium]